MSVRRYESALDRIVRHYDARSEIYTSDADLAAGMAALAREALQGNMAKQAALDWAADAIKAQDGGNMETETGWASDEALAHWLMIRRMAEQR
jgi:hypothetical protein